MNDSFAVAGEDDLHHLAEEVPRQLLLQDALLGD